MNSDYAPLLLRTCMCYPTICRPVQNHSWARAAVPALGSRHVAKLPSDITSALDRDSLTQMRSNTSSACYCSQKQYHYFHQHSSCISIHITSMTSRLSCGSMQLISFLHKFWGLSHQKCLQPAKFQDAHLHLHVWRYLSSVFVRIRVEFGISPSLGEKRSASAARSLR